jgi:hypothetical protein
VSIYDEIKQERDYQDGKWGHQTDDMLNTPWMWAAYLAQHSTRWMRGTFDLDTATSDAFRKAMVKTAALAVAAVESLDRQRATRGKAFYEN